LLVTRLGFWLARARGGGALDGLGTPLGRALAELGGRRLALVGNARALAAGAAGGAIDAADLVLRLNAAPIPASASHGARTDWLCLSLPIDAATLAARAPARVLWMPSSLGRLPWCVAAHPGFVLRDPARNARLRADLGAPASTGLLVLDLLAASPAAAVEIWGFDFFASLSLSGRRGAARVPHDFAAERRWAEALLARDRRFALRQP
jgi:hypothetical protein